MAKKMAFIIFTQKKDKYTNCVWKFYIHAKFSPLSYRCIIYRDDRKKKNKPQFHYSLSQWRNSLVVAQWLGLSATGLGLIPGQGTKIP